MKSRYLSLPVLSILLLCAPFSSLNAAPPPKTPAGALGPTKASQLVFSSNYNASTVDDPCGGNAVEIELSATPAVGEVLVVTGFSWTLTGADANSRASVALSRSDDSSAFQTVATSVTTANSDGVAVGSLALQPGVVALKGGDALYHLCINQFSSTGELNAGQDTGSLHGYLATDE